MPATPLPVAGAVLTTTHDWGFIGFIIAILTLLMTIPLGVAANLVAPRIRDWWASRSLASLMKRRELLTAKYEELQKLHPRDSNYDLILAMILGVGLIILFHLDCLIVIVMPSLFVFARTFPQWNWVLLPISGLVILVNGAGLWFVVTDLGYLDKAVGYVSLGHLHSVQEELENIESRISARQAN